MRIYFITNLNVRIIFILFKFASFIKGLYLPRIKKKCIIGFLHFLKVYHLKNILRKFHVDPTKIDKFKVYKFEASKATAA